MNMCRTCLRTSADKDISELENDMNGGNINYPDIMMFCLDIKVTQDCKITRNLCHKCYRKIISFYKFKALSLKNDAYLKSLNPVVRLVDHNLSVYGNENGIKHEDILDSEDFTPSLGDDFNTAVKVEEDLKNEENVCVGSDEEPLIMVQNVKHENIEDEMHSVSGENIEDEMHSVSGENIEDEMHSVSGENVEDEMLPVLSGNIEDEMHPPLGDFVRDEAELGDKGLKKKKKKEKDITGNDDVLLLPKIYKKRGPRKKKAKESHVGNAQLRQICEECGISVVNIRDHSVRHQSRSERQMLQCKACPKMFLTKGGRNKHYRITHLGRKAKCDICSKEVSCLSVHKKLVHDRDSLRFCCVRCGGRFVSQSTLDAHFLNHTRDFVFECDLCQKRFRTKSVLAKHIQGVHDKIKFYQCHYCPKAFFHKERLKSHIRFHTNERPYKCDECGKGFRDKNTLSGHMLVHSGAKGVRCDQCEMTFRRPCNLWRHMMTHSKEKRYPCRYCGARFGRSDHRARHEFTAHQKLNAKD